MDKRMNFEDSIFILNVRIRMIQDMFVLDADPGLFLNKTMDDLAFIDLCHESLLSSLKNNDRLIERDEQLYNLSESERIFCELLFELSHGETGFSAALDQGMRETASAMRNRSLERRRSIGDVIVESKNSNLEPVVSYDELHELLSG
ncbi:MAG: hypothetical protein LBP69_02455 [Treponema sp.]|jgi:hypothetical protein|nr:hypothetical protein [Treponema sp.]